MGGAAAEDYADDGGFACRAGFSGAVVDLVVFLEVAGLVVGIAVIAERAAAVVDGAVQDGFDALGQARDLGWIKFFGGDLGVDAGGEEGFVGVDVS